MFIKIAILTLKRFVGQIVDPGLQRREICRIAVTKV